MARWNLVILVGALLVLCTSCGIGTDSRQRVGGLGSGIAAYKATVYPIVRKKCADCHGRSRFPYFAGTEVDKSYRVAKEYVNFEDAAISTLVERSGDFHCGPRCAGGKDAMQAAIQRWWDEGELLGRGRPTIYGPLTVALPISDLLVAGRPDTSGYITLSWDLDEWGEAFVGAKLSLKIRVFDETTYEVTGLALKTGAVAIAMQEVRLLVNDVFRSQDSAYLNVDRFVLPNLTNQALSSSPMVMNRATGPAKDTIALAVKSISTGGCKDLALFEEKVLPIIQSPTVGCTECHGASNPRRGFRVDTGLTAEAICASSLSRIDRGNPSQSKLIQWPLLGTPMGTVPKITDDQASEILIWITRESQ